MLKTVLSCVAALLVCGLSLPASAGGLSEAGCDSACGPAACDSDCEGGGDQAACDGKCGLPGCDGDCISCRVADSCDQGAGCGGCDGCADCGCCDARLFGLFADSDHRFGRFISPMTNPIFFEDPRTLTEARFIFFHHVIPQDVGGGTVQLMAMQVRAALTDRLSIVAAKDGYATSSHPLIDDGWADVSVGLKYNLLADPCRQRLLSVGASYELPVGSSRLFQGNGDGEFHTYLTGGMQIGNDWHWISGAGLRLPVDRAEESQSAYWSNHVDRHLFGGFYALAECNWYYWFGSGENGIPGVEGLDIINFGSTDVAGNHIVTSAVGIKHKVTDHRELGVAWEFPLTDRRDIIDNRLTVDLIFRY